MLFYRKYKNVVIGDGITFSKVSFLLEAFQQQISNAFAPMFATLLPLQPCSHVLYFKIEFSFNFL